MSPRRLFSSDEIVSALLRGGFQAARKSKGSHQAFIRKRADGGTDVTIVVLAKREVPLACFRHSRCSGIQMDATQISYPIRLDITCQASASFPNHIVGRRSEAWLSTRIKVHCTRGSTGRTVKTRCFRQDEPAAGPDKPLSRPVWSNRAHRAHADRMANLTVWRFRRQLVCLKFRSGML